MGRRTVRTPQRMETILNALRGGATRKVAAAHAGISYESLRSWSVFSASFRAEMERAEADWELLMVASATRHARAGRINPLDALARHPNTRGNWGPNARLTIAGDRDEPLRIETEHRVPAADDADSKARLTNLVATLDVMVKVGLLPSPADLLARGVDPAAILARPPIQLPYKTEENE